MRDKRGEKETEKGERERVRKRESERERGRDRALRTTGSLPAFDSLPKCYKSTTVPGQSQGHQTYSSFDMWVTRT